MSVKSTISGPSTKKREKESSRWFKCETVLIDIGLEEDWEILSPNGVSLGINPCFT
jgi:hypothetical protein